MMLDNMKKKLKKTTTFVSDHQEAIGYTVYFVGAFIVGYKIGTTIFQQGVREGYKAHGYEQLRESVVAGHAFRFDTATNTLWDVTLRPDMAV